MCGSQPFTSDQLHTTHSERKLFLKTRALSSLEVVHLHCPEVEIEIWNIRHLKPGCKKLQLNVKTGKNESSLLKKREGREREKKEAGLWDKNRGDIMSAQKAAKFSGRDVHCSNQGADVCLHLSHFPSWLICLFKSVWSVQTFQINGTSGIILFFSFT